MKQFFHFISVYIIIALLLSGLVIIVGGFYGLIVILVQNYDLREFICIVGVLALFLTCCWFLRTPDVG